MGVDIERPRIWVIQKVLQDKKNSNLIIIFYRNENREYLQMECYRNLLQRKGITISHLEPGRTLYVWLKMEAEIIMFHHVSEIRLAKK